MRAPLLAGVLMLACVPANAHDYYREFWSGGAVGLGRWCCSGDLDGKTGDCSPATYTMNRDGSAWFSPRQFPGKHILVPRDRILWMAPPDPAAAKASEAHWCGKPRADGSLPTADDPDREFVTICASILPGGV